MKVVEVEEWTVSESPEYIHQANRVALVSMIAYILPYELIYVSLE